MAKKTKGKTIKKTHTKNVGAFVLLIAVVAVAFAATNAYFALNKYSEYGSSLAGYAGSEGYVNVTVVTVISVNFSNDTVNWSFGSISPGESNATLSTIGPTVTRGNWSTTAGSEPLILENIGSINASLEIETGLTAATLFAGSAAHQAYLINVTNLEAGSCNDAVEGYLSNWTDANTTTPGTKFCSQFGYITTQNSLRIDLSLTIPYDGNTGALSDTITANANTAG